MFVRQEFDLLSFSKIKFFNFSVMDFILLKTVIFTVEMVILMVKNGYNDGYLYFFVSNICGGYTITVICFA